MKKLSLHFFQILFLSAAMASPTAFATEKVDILESWWSSYALQEVVETVQISSLEFGWYFNIEEVELPSKSHLEDLSCVPAGEEDLLNFYQRAVEKYQSHYPDENLPYVQAHSEIKNMAGPHLFQMCSESLEIKGHQVNKVYFLTSNAEESDLVLQVEYENLFE